MANDILDEVDETAKYREPRTCPECGHQFPLGKFLSRYLRSYGLSKWPCHGCGKMIRCDFMKIQMLWLIAVMIYGAILGALIIYFDSGAFNLIFLLPYFAFILWTLSRAKFEKVIKQ